MQNAFTEHMISQRMTQIRIGKETQGYKNYLEKVKVRYSRNPDHPSTPDPYAPDSKRQFDGRLKVWRRKLREYDPEKETAKEKETGQVLEKETAKKMETANEMKTANVNITGQVLEKETENVPNEKETADDPWVVLQGPVTLRVCNSDDEREALEIKKNNPPGSVKIVIQKLKIPDPDEWLELHAVSHGAKKLYF